MIVNNIFLGFIALCAGFAVAGGVVAFIITIGMIPRFIHLTRTAEHIVLFEKMVFLGTIGGCVLSLYGKSGFFVHLFQKNVWITHGFLGTYGIFAGMFTGCLSAALAEIINVIPILFRHIKPVKGVGWIVLAFALGKMAGTIFQFY